MDVNEETEAAAHVARLVRRDDVVTAAVDHIATALGEGHRLLLVHADTLDGSALNLALEERGISLPFRSGPVELSHNAGSRDVLRAAAERTLLFGSGPLKVVCTAAHAMPALGSSMCLPVDGLEQLVEVECLFTVEQPTGTDIARLLGHDAVIIDGVPISLADPEGKLATLGELLRLSRRVETVDRLLRHPGFGSLPSVLLDQLERSHYERIRQRQELTSLRGDLTLSKRQMDVALADANQLAEIDRRISSVEGDVGALMSVASEELGANLILEDHSFALLRWSGSTPPASLRSLLEGRLSVLARELEPGVPSLVRLGQPSAGSRLVMRLGADLQLGYLSIPLSAAHETNDQRAWLERLRVPVAAARRVEVEMVELIERVGRHILRDLASGRLSSGESRSAASQLGWISGDRSSIVVLSPPDKAENGPLEDRLSHMCDRLNHDSFTAAVVDDEVVVLCTTDDQMDRIERFASRSEGLVVGIGSFGEQPELASRARVQASWAARLARASHRSVLDFGEIGIHRLLLPGSEGGDPEFEEPIVRLEDRAHALGFDPVETLRVFLDCGASPRVAAARLNIHINTLRNKIKRISEVAELDLADPERRFQADLALRLRMSRSAFAADVSNESPSRVL